MRYLLRVVLLALAGLIAATCAAAPATPTPAPTPASAPAEPGAAPPLLVRSEDVSMVGSTGRPQFLDSYANW
jgi:hypothetical protein